MELALPTGSAGEAGPGRAPGCPCSALQTILLTCLFPCVSVCLSAGGLLQPSPLPISEPRSQVSLRTSRGPLYTQSVRGTHRRHGPQTRHRLSSPRWAWAPGGTAWGPISTVAAGVQAPRGWGKGSTPPGGRVTGPDRRQLGESGSQGRPAQPAGAPYPGPPGLQRGRAGTAPPRWARPGWPLSPCEALQRCPGFRSTGGWWGAGGRGGKKRGRRGDRRGQERERENDRRRRTDRPPAERASRAASARGSRPQALRSPCEEPRWP